MNNTKEWMETQEAFLAVLTPWGAKMWDTVWAFILLWGPLLYIKLLLLLQYNDYRLKTDCAVSFYKRKDKYLWHVDYDILIINN